MKGTRRVVVTGLGAVSPLGNSVEESWRNLLAGQSGAAPIAYFDASDYPVSFSCSVKGFDASAYISAKEAKKMDAFIHYGIAAGVQALHDSGLEISDANADRVGVMIGAGIGGILGIERAHATLQARGPRKVTPFFVPSSIVNMVAGNLSILLGARGPNYSIVSACSSGGHSIGEAARSILYGDADAMLAGGAENATSPLGVSGFAAARALSVRNDDPRGASRPWDRERDGFVMGDGAGVLMLEEYGHARARGARIYAELIGFGMSADAYHMTAPMPGGEGAALCMENALRDADATPEQVAYINAHGTSTPLGDLAESRAVKRVFGAHAKRLAVNSTKSMTGHMLGAAGGIEAIFTVLALRDQVSPPTINLFEQDPECDLDHVANQARDMRIDIGMSNSFGFGGTNSTLIFRKISAAA